MYNKIKYTKRNQKNDSVAGPDVPHCTMNMKRCEYLIEFCGKWRTMK